MKVFPPKAKCKEALEIACMLLNGDFLYGIDNGILFEKLMEKDGVVSSKSYQNFILGNLDRFSDNDKTRAKAIEKLGW